MSQMMHRAPRLLGSLAVVATLSVTALLASSAAHAGPETAPQLSIAIDNGRTAAKVGDTLDYRIVVKNLGPARVKKLHITQSMPPGLTAKKADSDGVVSRTKVSWTVNIKGASKTILTTSTSVSKTSKQTLRLASVACASTGTKSPPIVCASHSDQLAAGAKAESAAAKRTADGKSPWLFYAGIAVAVGAMALLFVIVQRRRGRSGDASHAA